MSKSSSRARNALRDVHVALAAVLGVCFYWPLAGIGRFDVLMLRAVFPGFGVRMLLARGKGSGRGRAA